MKINFIKYVLFVIAEITFFSALGQVSAIQNNLFSVSYPGLNNYLTIVSENVKCVDLVVKVDNGIIKKEAPCKFKYKPERVGKANVSIFKIQNKDTIHIEEKQLLIKRWPNPKARIGRFESGEIPKSMLLFHSREIVQIEAFDICGRHTVQKFQFHVIKNNEITKSISNKGGKFNKEIISTINALNWGDKIIIDNIKVKMPGESISREIEKLEFIIVK